ncbi:2OG-Fe(II) oxygenase [Kordiimonas marina]|uniref:2OG-Fe(II) oxygenase n=1 Tax=Kordiimonas marina TaxID=2872312 RepID=UPI001FF116C5|nr:2OG-Fe(II) oxygenase [Kordiimonas marina]MCJ9429371.1 2OG-Fe(II) oxygenase [Kordiimonas marina]
MTPDGLSVQTAPDLTVGEPDQALTLAPFVLPVCLSHAECAALIALFEDRDAGRSRLTGGVAVSAVRSSSSLWFDDRDVPWLAGRLSGLAAKACREAFPFEIDGFEEGYQLLRYDAPSADAPDGDFYHWHVDIGGHGTARSRKLTLIVQLSAPESYTGGALELNADGTPETLPAEAGMGLAFPSFMPHRVRPVESGVRYSLVAWLHGPAFR